VAGVNSTAAAGGAAADGGGVVATGASAGGVGTGAGGVPVTADKLDRSFAVVFSGSVGGGDVGAASGMTRDFGGGTQTGGGVTSATAVSTGGGSGSSAIAAAAEVLAGSLATAGNVAALNSAASRRGTAGGTTTAAPHLGQRRLEPPRACDTTSVCPSGQRIRSGMPAIGRRRRRAKLPQRERLSPFYVPAAAV
jgi:hypothetical protein